MGVGWRSSRPGSLQREDPQEAVPLTKRGFSSRRESWFWSWTWKNDSSFNPEAGRMIHRAQRTFLMVGKVSGKRPDREKKNEESGDQS